MPHFLKIQFIKPLGVFTQQILDNSPFIDLVSKVFGNGLENLGSIPSWVILKTQKMVLDATLFNTQHYKVRIKGKVKQSREWSSTLSYTSV